MRLYGYLLPRGRPIASRTVTFWPSGRGAPCVIEVDVGKFYWLLARA